MNKYLKIAIDAANEDFEKIFANLKLECTAEQIQLINEALLSNELDIFNFFESNEGLFPATKPQRAGIASLLSYKNFFSMIESENLEKGLLPLMMASSASQMYRGREIVFQGLQKACKESADEAIKKNTSNAGKKSNSKKYPWKEGLKEIARNQWRKKNIFHNELADWICTEYKTADGRYPYSGPLQGIKEGNERQTILKTLKKVAKEPEFSSRNLIKSGY